MAVDWTSLTVGGGALLVLYGWVMAFRRSGRTMGKITGIVESKDSEDRPILAPVISYQVNGKKHSFEARMAMSSRKNANKRIGRKVPVAFDPVRPEDAEVASWFRLYFGQIVLTAAYALGLYAWWKG